jgi:hypothetical protein
VEQAAASSGVSTDWHFEFLDMVEEGDVMYRHFRMMPEAFLTWMGALSASERPTDAYFEYWDNAETLAPYRLVNQDGSLVVFESMAPADDDAAEVLLGEMGKGTSWDDVLTCLSQEQDDGEPVQYTNGFLLPKMVSPMSDLDEGALQFYATMIGGETEFVDNESANNAGWDTLVAITNAADPLADFAAYARKSNNPLAMADVCASFCPDVVSSVTTAAKATEDICATPGLDLLSACIFQDSVQVHECGKSPAAVVVQECEEIANSATRRLSGGDEFDEEGDFEDEEEEDKMKVTTISSGALKQASEPGAPMPVLSKLADGSNSLDLEDLDDGTRAQLARMLNLESTPKTGKILFNSTTPAPGEKIEKVPGLVDLPGVDSPAASRRLFFDMKCLFPNVGPGCIFSIWWPKSGYSWCDPIDGSPPCKFSIAVKIQLTGPAAGALTIAGSGCVEAWKFSVPPPFAGSVCISGGITFGFAKSCGNKFPFTINGWVRLVAAVGLDFGIFSFTAAEIGVEVGAGIQNYETHCWSQRRRRRWWGGGTRKCNYACDIRVYGRAWRSVFWIVKIWLQVEYWVSHKDWNFLVGIDVCWPWPWSYCYTPVSIKIF